MLVARESSSLLRIMCVCAYTCVYACVRVCSIQKNTTGLDHNFPKTTITITYDLI